MLQLSPKLVKARLFIFNFPKSHTFYVLMYFYINISILYVEKFLKLNSLLACFGNSTSLLPAIAIAWGMGNYSLIVEE